MAAKRIIGSNIKLVSDMTVIIKDCDFVLDGIEPVHGKGDPHRSEFRWQMGIRH